MKKLILGILAVAMMVLGLSAAPAQAGPYTGTIGTKVSITSARTVLPNRANAIMTVKVTPTSGRVTVKGGVQMICRATIKGKRVTKYGPRQGYRGGNLRVFGPQLTGPRRWTCNVKYYGGASVFKSSTSTVKRIRVTR